MKLYRVVKMNYKTEEILSISDAFSILDAIKVQYEEKTKSKSINENNII